jgi:hypothetical protein
MVDFWYSSYIFLGLSIAVGVGIFIVYREISKRRAEKKDNPLMRELREKYLPPEERDK